MNRGGRVKISIIDDCEIFSAGLCAILERTDEFAVISRADFKSPDAHTFPEPPDIILVHTAAGSADYHAGMIKSARESAPSARILLISEFLNEEHITNMLMSGCDGYILSSVSADSLKLAIRNVNSDILIFDRRLMSRIFQSDDRAGRQARAQAPNPRETMIIKAISNGLTNRQIASEMKLASGTVRNIISAMLMRYGWKKRSQLVNLLADNNFAHGFQADSARPAREKTGHLSVSYDT
jgi:DNA-binding NarL/FixJ family response regulator